MNRMLTAICMIGLFIMGGTADAVIGVDNTDMSSHTGAFYQMRKGETDNVAQDMFPKTWNDDWCYLMGSQPRVTVTLRDDPTSGTTGYPMGWSVRSWLADVVTLETIWDFESAIMPYSTTQSYNFPALPNKVGYWFVNLKKIKPLLQRWR